MTKPAGFWGLVVEPGKIYTQKVPEAFRITMASLGAEAADREGKGRAALQLTHHKDGEFTLCTLAAGRHEQQPVDFVFTEGETIHLRVVGDLAVHLTGYYVELDAAEALDFDGFGDEACSETDEDACVDTDDESVCGSDECCSDDMTASSEYDSDDMLASDDDESIDSEEVEPRIVEICDEKPAAAPAAKKPKVVEPAAARADKGAEAVADAKAAKRAEKAAREAASASGRSTPASMASPTMAPAAPVSAAVAPVAEAAAKSHHKGIVITEVKAGTPGATKATKDRVVSVTLTPMASAAANSAAAGARRQLSFGMADVAVMEALRVAVRNMGAGGERRVTVPAAVVRASAAAKERLCDLPTDKDGNAHFAVRLDSVSLAKA